MFPPFNVGAPASLCRWSSAWRAFGKAWAKQREAFLLTLCFSTCSTFFNSSWVVQFTRFMRAFYTTFDMKKLGRICCIFVRAASSCFVAYCLNICYLQNLTNYFTLILHIIYIIYYITLYYRHFIFAIFHPTLISLVFPNSRHGRIGFARSNLSPLSRGPRFWRSQVSFPLLWSWFLNWLQS